AFFDGTDFGLVSKGASVAHTFVVRNDGSAPLFLGPLSVPVGFTITEGLSSTLAPGASDAFTVRLNTASLGIKSGQITVGNNDSDENPFNFSVTGTVAAPEVSVEGNGWNITDGDASPSASDGTHFGNAVRGGTAVSHTFVVRNDGNSPLIVGGLHVPS